MKSDQGEGEVRFLSLCLWRRIWFRKTAEVSVVFLSKIGAGAGDGSGSGVELLLTATGNASLSPVCFSPEFSIEYRYERCRT